MYHLVSLIKAMPNPICRTLFCKQIIYQMHCKSLRRCHIYCYQIVGSRLKVYHNIKQCSSVSLRPAPSLGSYSLNFEACYSNGSKLFEDQKPEKTDDDTGKPKKPKKELKTYITLLGVDNSICVSTVEESRKIAERRGLKLVKVVDFDPKSSRAVYKLVTESQYLKDDWDDPQSKKEKSDKDEKLISLSSRTNKNDVMTKLNMMKKWLAKRKEVKVVITGDTKAGETVYKMIEKELGSEGRIVQKKTKSSTIRFQICMPKENEGKIVEKVDK